MKFLLFLLLLVHTVKIAWDPNSEANLAGYRIYRSEQQGVYPAMPLYVTSATEWLDASAQPGHTYYYVVTAFSTDSESSYSNEITVTVTDRLGPTL